MAEKSLYERLGGVFAIAAVVCERGTDAGRGKSRWPGSGYPDHGARRSCAAAEGSRMALPGCHEPSPLVDSLAQHLDSRDADSLRAQQFLDDLHRQWLPR